jgi:hypothetical protein
MRDDVVQHLAAIDILEEHVPMIVRALNIPHGADVGMIQQGNDCRLPRRSNLFGVVLAFTFTSALLTVV